MGNGLIYEAVIIQCSIIRALAWCQLRSSSQFDAQALILLKHACDELIKISTEYVEAVETTWRLNGDDLLGCIPGSALFVTYPVLCQRIVEVGVLSFLFRPSLKTKKFLEEFLVRETGVCRPIGDRYTISLVLGVLFLVSVNRADTACNILREATVWICDRIEYGCGLASVEASPNEEVATVFGVIDHRRINFDSFLATAIIDLAAFIGSSDVYADAVNDFLAVGVAFQYWQAQVTSEQFKLDGNDVIHYPNITFTEPLVEFHNSNYGEHIVYEPDRTIDNSQLSMYVAVMLLLRDRYFPKLWSQLIKVASDNLQPQIS